jgi:hypothetical protein
MYTDYLRARLLRSVRWEECAGAVGNPVGIHITQHLGRKLDGLLWLLGGLSPCAILYLAAPNQKAASGRSGTKVLWAVQMQMQ